MCRAGGNYVPRMRFVWCVCRSRFVLMGHRRVLPKTPYIVFGTACAT